MKQKLSRYVAAASSLLLASSLVACSDSSPSEGGGELEKIRVVLDWDVRPYHAGLLFALEDGLYKDAGLDVTIEGGKGSATSATLLGQGGFDIANINVTNAVQTINKGVPISVATVYQPTTAASFVGLKGNVTLDGPSSLEGLEIGSTPGGSDGLGLSAFSAVTGIADLNVVGLDSNAKTSALLTGQIDVVSGDSHAYAAIIRGQGEEPEILSLSELDIPLLGFGFVVNNDFAKAHGDAVDRFIEASQAGFEKASKDPKDACNLLIGSYNLTGGLAQCVDYAEEFAELAESPDDPSWSAPADEKTMSRLVKLLTDIGELKNERPISDYLRQAE